MKLTLDIDDAEQLANICGSLGRNLETIAKSFEAGL